MKKILKISLLLTALWYLSSCVTRNTVSPEYGVNGKESGISIKEVDNFRTLGDIKNIEGKRLRSGMLYRSGNLHHLRKTSFNTIKQLGIQKIIDLRTEKEIVSEPDRLPDYTIYKKYPAFEDRENLFSQGKKLVLKGKIDSADADRKVVHFYREYLTENPEMIKKIITEILDSERPVLYHCTAGKDRTGMVTALILTILKFDRETIDNEYLLSNNFRKDLVMKRIWLARTLHFLYPKMDLRVLGKVSWVEKSYLDAAFDEIDKKYGSMDTYIQQVLGISEEKRAVYLRKFTY